MLKCFNSSNKCASSAISETHNKDMKINFGAGHSSSANRFLLSDFAIINGQVTLAKGFLKNEGKEDVNDIFENVSKNAKNSPVNIKNIKMQTQSHKKKSSNPIIIEENNLFTKLNLDSANKEQNIIENGSSLGKRKYKGNSYYFKNTCPFDSITELVISAYIHRINCKEFINSFKNENEYMLMICNYVKKNFYKEIIYSKRAELLFPNSIMSSDSVDCRNKISIILQILSSNCNLIKKRQFCENCSETCKVRRYNYISLPPFINKFIIDNGMQELQYCLNKYFSTQSEYKCTNCDAMEVQIHQIHQITS